MPTATTSLKEGHKLVERYYDRIWYDLQEAGVGIIMLADKRQPHRFDWYYNMRLVAQAALDGTDVDFTGRPGETATRPTLTLQKKAKLRLTETIQEAKGADAVKGLESNSAPTDQNEARSQSFASTAAVIKTSLSKVYVGMPSSSFAVTLK